MTGDRGAGEAAPAPAGAGAGPPGPVGAEATPEDAGAGRVVLDIGGEIGAAVVHAPASCAGREIEIRAKGTEWDGTHVAVHRRSLPAGAVYAAVFPSLREGRWEVRYRDDVAGPTAALDVIGGRVATGALG